MKKIILGTAQFGMDYGINNKKGKVPQTETFEILNNAVKFGIDTVDTAHSYGESERILGSFIRCYPDKLKVVSKLPECGHGEVKTIFMDSLNKLNLSKIYGYLIHGFRNYKKDKKIWQELKKLKIDRKVEKIGFSLYFPTEFEAILQDGLEIDMLQVPFSIFDQRFKPYFSELKKRKIEIYVRSVFLQGLVFKKPEELDEQFLGIKDKLKQLHLISKETGIPLCGLCLGFAVADDDIDKIVIGVDSTQHFNEIMQTSDFLSKLDNIIPRLSDLEVNDEQIILPFNWNTHRVIAS